MKKKGITLFLALGLASGSMGALPVLAGGAAEQGIGSVQKTKLTAEKISDLAGSEKEYAASAEAADDKVDSGLCGEYVAWTLTGSGDNLTLTLSGSGPMLDYEESDVPWASDRGRIKKVVIEEGITSVGDSACYSMDHLTEVSLPDSLESIGFSGFENCKALKSVEFPKNLEIINGEAFLGCSALTELVFPDGLITIDDYAFTGCSSLTSITVPDSVTRIGDFSFRDCDQLSRINISDLASWLGIEFEQFSFVQGDLYLNGELLTEIVYPEGTKEIGQGPVSCITSIKKVTIPESVTKIGENAFQGCTALTDINIPDGVTDIDVGAFLGCSSLTDITIPDSVLRINDNAFAECESLTNVNISDNLISIGASAFLECGSLAELALPDSLESIGDAAFAECGSLKSLTISDKVNTIGANAFPETDEKAEDFVIFTGNPYVKEYCRSYNCFYFDKAAPSIADLTSYNGSEIHVSFDQEDEVLTPENGYGEDYELGYQIRYADHEDMTGARAVFLKDKKAASTVITDLENGKTYYVQIQHYVKNARTSYWSKWSKIRSVTVDQTPYPVNISGLSAYTGSCIKVDWTRTNGASGYHIKYADNSDMTDASEVFIKGNRTFTRTLTGLEEGKTYYVMIQTYRTVSEQTFWSKWSRAVSVKVEQKPYGTFIKELIQESDTGITIIWNREPSASGYHIQYGWYEEDDFVTEDLYVNDMETLSKTISGLDRDAYSVRIQTYRKASGKTWWSSWSDWEVIRLLRL